MNREIVEHLRDAEQVHIGRFEGAGLFLIEESAASLIDPCHRQVQ
ncbi:MAG: hypothetical protein WCC47_24355 [Pseudonocardiaceae bacterium]